LCQRLQKEGATLRVHDPKAMKKARDLLANVVYVDDMDDVAEGCDALVLATEWDEFRKLDLRRVREALTHPIVFDGRNLFDPAEMERLGFIYKCIGRHAPTMPYANSPAGSTQPAPAMHSSIRNESISAAVPVNAG
ncbi:MAG: UDP-glucose 6-dehydrogenase, partial [Akkermansiaceae bacterium]|nr:UDP-glucose 6-dehydrogenase [Verrucomicrobiales bacterium]